MRQCVTFIILAFLIFSFGTQSHAEESDPPIDKNMLAALIQELKNTAPLPIVKNATVNKDDVPKPKETDPASHFTQNALLDKSAQPTAVDQILNRDISPLERAYSKRALKNGTLKQFGYDIFSSRNERAMAGAVQDDFVLGINDVVTVTYRGARTDKRDYTVNRDGQLLIDGVTPIMAAGRSFKDVTEEAGSAIKSSALNTDAYFSLDKVRQIGVQVIGEVPKPGRQDLSALSTVMDALNASGGVKKTGSLRQIILSRGDGWKRKIDLYHLLLTGSKDMDMPLREGDRILVPPIGQTIAMTGDLKREGIYELPAGEDERDPRLNLQQVLYLSGETTQPAGLKLQRSRLHDDGRDVRDSAGKDIAFADGDILIARRYDSGARGDVELSGNVRSPGTFALDNAPTLQALLGDGGVADDNIYPLMGVIERKDRSNLSSELVPFAPGDITSGTTDKALREGDKIKLFSKSDIKDLMVEKAPVNDKRSAFGIAVPDSEEEQQGAGNNQFALQQKVSLRGAVQNPGPYPVGGATTLDKLIAAAGGLRNDADKSAVEIIKASKSGSGDKHDWQADREVVDLTLTDPHGVKIPPGASVRVSQNMQVLSQKGIVIAGEVRRPGTYDLMRGEKLSSLIERAGGYTNESYPMGTLFTRESARRREAELFRRAADELDVALSRSLSKTDKLPSEDKLDNARQLVNELRNSQAVGRITVEADPAVLAVRPDLDPLLESGDRIYIPKRTVNVHVAGEVFAPASLKFSSNKTASEYIEEAGGVTRLADDDKSFVVMPDGSAKPLALSAWNHENVLIPPGSTIIVPRDPDPVSFLQITQSLGSIFSQLAVSAAALSAINNDR